MSETNAIGDTLRAARERMGLDAAQAAERLHVDIAVIEALESGSFARLGAPVFVRGHLRRYAELLGESDAPLQSRYAALSEASVAPDLTQLPLRAAATSRGSAPRWPLVMVAVLLLVGAIIWWALRTRVT